jgi:lipooligosaccharide transport system permease protein
MSIDSPTVQSIPHDGPSVFEAVKRQTTYWLVQYQRTWRGTVISSFLTPALYLAAMGLGLGHYVNNRSGGSALGNVSYLAYIAPGLLATTAMQAAVFESTYPVMAMFKWDKVYFAMLATPLRVRDVIAAHLASVAARLFLTLFVFLLVISAFGAVTWWGVLPALLAALLTGMAFATPIFALTSRVRDESSFSLLYRLGLLPMFLFSGAFFPISHLPTALTWLAYATPVWHGVDLCRQFTLGDVRPASAALHVVYLAAWTVVGWWWAERGFNKRLTW